MTTPAQDHPTRQNHSAAATDGDPYRWRGLAIFGLYLAISLIYFARGLPGHSGNWYIGRETDPGQTMWFFNWWRFSLSRGLNPFITDWVWAPLGINLAWTTFVPLPALISIPLQVTVGEPATYNTITILIFTLAPFAAFLLCQRVTRAFWPSVLGGYIFGYSSYMLGQVLAHLVEFAVFPVPLIALMALKRLDGGISARRYAIVLAALLTVQFLCAVELFATVTMVGGLALLLALALFDGDLRTRLAGLIAPTIAAYVMAAVVLSPYLYYLLALGFPHTPIWSPGNFSGDLLNYFVPTETGLLGTFGFARAITGTFGGDIYENGAYIGIPLLIMIETYRRATWRTSVGRFLIAMLAITIVASFGPELRVAGRPEFPMPWAIAGRLPLISIALPIRFMMYASLILGVMIAMWFAASTPRPLTKCLAAAAILASIAPNPHATFWVSNLDTPAFFTKRTYATKLEPREIILPLPFAQKGNSMYWQLQSDMYFRMAGGWTGISPFEFQRMPIVSLFMGQVDLPEAGDQLKAYLGRFDVAAIVVDPSYERFDTFGPALASLRVAAEKSDGLLIYKIPPEKFAAYAKLTGAGIEARALALRFDTVLAASANFIARGNDPLKLSPSELKRLSLLPPDWQINIAPNSVSSWAIGVLADGRIGIALWGWGSPQGVKPLLDRYLDKSELLYPAPSRWNPRSSSFEDQLGPLLIVFDRGQFEAAARQLEASPPPERTTPFLGVESRP
jgi:hypothetical protein